VVAEFKQKKKKNEDKPREIFYNIRTQFSMPMKTVRLIKMCLNEIYNKARINRNLSDEFHDTSR